MRKLAKLLFWAVACLSSFAAHAQVAVISGQAIDQNGQPLPNVQVRVCSVTSTGVPCTPTASIYQDFGLTVPAPNPTTTDQYGNYTVYAGTLPAPNLYTVQYSPESGVTWAYVVNGPFLSASGGIVTGYITALGYNGVPEADQCSGVDAWAKINTCATMIPSGGVEDARGFGAGQQVVTTAMTALQQPTRPITLELNPATVFLSNVVFSAGSIAAKTACMIPIGQGSAIETPGLNQALNIRLGPLAQTYDVVCNAVQDGTQESFRIDGLGIWGNASATMAGSLIHVKNVFAGTQIKDIYTYQPFGTALTDEGGSDHFYVDDNFSDSSTTGGYAGSVVNMICPNNVTFQNGAIQFNGINNPLVTISGYSPTGPSQCPIGTSATGVHFYNVDYEIQPATVGSFAGAATNVDPFQITDGEDILIDKLILYGTKGAGQNHIVDLLSSGNNGQSRGPIEIDNIRAEIGAWGTSALITNNATGFVSPTQTAVKGTQLGSDQIGIGKYRWEGDSFAGASEIDYLDTETLSTFRALSTNGDIDPTLQAGSDIGVQIMAALAQCASVCQIKVPPGTYTYSTQINLPLNQYSKFSLELDSGATMLYTGSGDAIRFTVVGGPTEGNCKISGGQLYGSASGTSGIHIMPTNTCTVSSMIVAGFSNGAGIWLDGPNAVTVQDNLVFGNQIGVKLSPTYCDSVGNCGIGVAGSGYTPNNIRIVNNTIVANSQWGIQSADPVTALLTGALNDLVDGNDLEGNGGAGPAFGALNFGRSHGLIVKGDYFEGSPRQVVLGIPNGGDGNTRFFSTQGAVIRDNYFTELKGTPYSIELLDTQDTIIEGNSTLDVSMGSLGTVVSGTYTSGITATGSSTQTCTLTGFNNSSTATATVALTGTNTIASGTPLVITSQGSGATSAPTNATAGSGTATCSGAAVVVTQLGTNSFINSLANNGSNIGEMGTYYGANHIELSGGGSYTSVAGVPGPLVGAGTFPIVNTNYQWKLEDQNYALTSSGASEVVTLSGTVTGSSVCRADPFNATAGAVGSNGIYVIPIAGTGSVTFYHPSGQAGTRWNISCAEGPFN